MLYRVNLENIQQAITVIRRQQGTLEDQMAPEFLNALSQDLIQGDSKAAQELQQALDDYNRTAQELSNILKKLEESFTSILSILK